MRPILNLAEVPLVRQSHGAGFEAAMGQVGAALGAQKLGSRLTVVPPGKRAWPHHCHHANEELFVILAGTGTLRLGADRHAVTAGDVIVCRCGGPETAHQLINTGTVDLRYLAVSTMLEPEVCEYPDSGRFGVMAGAGPGGDKARRRFQYHGRDSGAADYWEGEEG